MRLLIFISSLVFFTACKDVKSNNQPGGTNIADTTKPGNAEKEKQKPGGMVGGPCTYRSDTLPAKLIRLTPANNQYSALFAVQRCIYCKTDTVSYYISNNRYISTESKSKIDTGKVYQLIVQSILTGTCTPRIEQFNLEEYKQ